jgi:hypothetical protein
MTGEEHLEEMLWEAHKKGIYSELMEFAKELRVENIKMSLADSIYKAYYMMEVDLVEI